MYFEVKVDIHAHFIHPVFFDAMMGLPGVSIRTTLIWATGETPADWRLPAG
jgi:hypothetical protein